MALTRLENPNSALACSSFCDHVILCMCMLYVYKVIYLYNNGMCAHRHLRACMHAYIHTHTHTCMHACIHTYIHTHIYIYVLQYISVCVCTYAHASTSTYSVWKICRQKYAQNFKLSLCSLSLTSRQIVQKPPEEGGGSPGSSDPAAS